MNYAKTLTSDVLVFGAGPAGISAAVSAAREGKTVRLIETQNVIGGVLSACPGMMLGAGYPCKKTIGGFFQELVDRMSEQNPPIGERRVCSLENFGDEVVYSYEHTVSLFYDILQEAGVTLHINHMPLNVLLQDNKITGVEVVNSNGLNLFTAGVYLDCTGNGDIAVKAGVPYILGNEQGLMMGATLTFFMENVNWEKAFADDTDPYFTAYAEQAIKDGKIHESIPQIYMLKGYREGSVFFNTVTVTGVDGTDSDSVLAGTNTARKRVLDLAKFCKENLPGFENSFVSRIGNVVGIRETRKLEGLYQITYGDIFKGEKFQDGIVACDNPLDEVFRDEETKFYSHEAALEHGNYYTIPFRCFVPKEIKNLMFAGRNISVDVKAFASVRGMPQCMIMGQAIGIGAAIALNEKTDVQQINHVSVVSRLIEHGVKGIGGNSL